jgi:diaminopimelate epimerase
MNTEKFLVAGGNPTLLVWDCPPQKQVAISKQRLVARDVEQVGFITFENGVMYLMMMGNELCINAALALASVGGESGKFFTRGIDYLVSYTNDDRTTVERRPPFKKKGESITTIELRLPFRQEGETILFDGIGYSCYRHEVTITKEKIIGLAKQYNLPAFGIIECKDKTITPHVYVADTGLLINESACGSGSIAASIILGVEDIIQPSGETIKIKRSGNLFQVSAQVQIIPDHTSKLGTNSNHFHRAINYGLTSIT